MISRVRILLLTLMIGWAFYANAAEDKPRIGVTLHPYYSFVANIVGDLAEVVPLIKEGYNPHNYTPQPDDIKRATTLDLVVLNAIGHDEFAFEILEAAQVKDSIRKIYANEKVALIPISGIKDSVNSHTFISITASIQQIYHIARELGRAFPEYSKAFRSNSRKYAARLRKMKAEYVAKLKGAATFDFRCATIHGGYDYLLQEFGLQVAAVIEPQHGLQPNASELKKTIETIKALKVGVVFSQMDFPPNYIEAIRKETGITIRHFSHISKGPYSPEAFEKGMRYNLESLTNAILEANQ